MVLDGPLSPNLWQFLELEGERNISRRPQSVHMPVSMEPMAACWGEAPEDGDRGRLERWGGDSLLRAAKKPRRPGTRG